MNVPATLMAALHDLDRAQDTLELVTVYLQGTGDHQRAGLLILLTQHAVKASTELAQLVEHMPH